jgi:UDP-hydrolysing UDP-N-acetyl-D-glucosamine 2-epimerase
LGDRYEALSFAIACQIAQVPLAHIHGGEVTEGAIDDSFRHSITKLSYLHFASAEAYRNRIIQLGEAPERVFNTGALGIDNIKNTQKISRSEFENKFSIKLKKFNFLITFHPETLSVLSPENQIKGLVEALEIFKQEQSDECFYIFTMPNSDHGNEVLFSKIYEFVKHNSGNSIALKSMGRVNYLSAMSHCDVVVGNSSSGIIEAPSMDVPTVNIGARQKGRLRANSVVDCAYDSVSILNSLQKAIDFKKSNKKIVSLFGSGDAAEKMKSIIKSVSLNHNIQKSFYDRH